MWIISSLISAYARATGESTTDSERFCQLCEQSVMWRSKPSQSQTWSRRWKRDCWIRHLSTLTYEDSTGCRIVARYLSSPLVLAANPSHSTESESQPRMNALSGRALIESSVKFNRPLYSSKTYPELFPPELAGSRSHRYSMMSFADWTRI